MAGWGGYDGMGDGNGGLWVCDERAGHVDEGRGNPACWVLDRTGWVLHSRDTEFREEVHADGNWRCQ